jgi:beta-lactamase regulating signal transducer with metallopeptidase domain
MMTVITMAPLLFEIAMRSIALTLIFIGIRYYLRRTKPISRRYCGAVSIVGLLCLPFLTLLPSRISLSLPEPFTSTINIESPQAIPIVAPALTTPVVSTTSLQKVTSSSFSLPILLLSLWGIGTLLCLVRLLQSQWTLRRLYEQSTAVTVNNYPVRLAPVPIPAVAGVLRPVLYLPKDALDWESERRDIVLQHEIAHIKHHDTRWVLAAELCRALYWWNPLLYHLLEQLRQDMEHVADDAVVQSGIAPTTYATHLVEIAATLKTRLNTPALVPLARNSELQTRLTQLLQTSPVVFSKKRGVLLALLALLPILSLLPLTIHTDKTIPAKENYNSLWHRVTPHGNIVEIVAVANKDGLYPINKEKTSLISESRIEQVRGLGKDEWRVYLHVEGEKYLFTDVRGRDIRGSSMEIHDKTAQNPYFVAETLITKSKKDNKISPFQVGIYSQSPSKDKLFGHWKKEKGEWKPIFLDNALSFQFDRAIKGDMVKIKFPTISVSENPRLEIFKKNIPMASPERSSIDSVYPPAWVFRPIPDEATEIKLYARDYEWIEFKNIPLPSIAQQKKQENNVLTRTFQVQYAVPSDGKAHTIRLNITDDLGKQRAVYENRHYGGEKVKSEIQGKGRFIEVFTYDNDQMVNQLTL